MCCRSVIPNRSRATFFQRRDSRREKNSYVIHLKSRRSNYFVTFNYVQGRGDKLPVLTLYMCRTSTQHSGVEVNKLSSLARTLPRSSDWFFTSSSFSNLSVAVYNWCLADIPHVRIFQRIFQSTKHREERRLCCTNRSYKSLTNRDYSGHRNVFTRESFQESWQFINRGFSFSSLWRHAIVQFSNRRRRRKKWRLYKNLKTRFSIDAKCLKRTLRFDIRIKRPSWEIKVH